MDKLFNNYEILFQDSPEYFTMEHSRMIVVDGLLMFRKFDPLSKEPIEDVFFPIGNIHRIKKKF